jgi:hypothetical protein
MKVLLMHKERNFDTEAAMPLNEVELMQDLELDILLSAMAKSDKFMHAIAKKALLISLSDKAEIMYRQEILCDAIKNEALVRELYAIAVEAIEAKKRNWFGIYVSSPGSILYSAGALMEMYVPLLEKLHALAEHAVATFTAPGFRRFFSMITEELCGKYFQEIQEHLDALKFRDGVLISSKLASGCEASEHVLRISDKPRESWLQRLLSPRSPTYSFSVSPRDEAGCHALDEIRNRGLNCAANALARATDHIESFFTVLRAELAFYIGCLNAREQLTRLGETLCFPDAHEQGSLSNRFNGLYNICLSLHLRRKTVGNDMDAVDRNPIIITGVNEGGKSTFLRSLGTAQLMMQCGMFVPAISFSADIVSGVFTHFRRKEDRTMSSGKFDEELVRMSSIADQLRPHALILFNESFAATNEREGSDIARQICAALVEQGIRVVFVTHLYTFAQGITASARKEKFEPALPEVPYNPLFLKAERKSDGSRTFILSPGEPAPKSHGEDLYRKVFGTEEVLPRNCPS